jgi:hypothetical protein
MRQIVLRSTLLALLLGLPIWLPINSAPITTYAAAASDDAITVLSTIEIKGRAPKTGFSRAQFPHWADLDRNGCDSRNEILKRDLTQIVFKVGTRDCKVIAGVLLDPFSGKQIVFSTGKSIIDIDHVVALSNAWQSGAVYFDKVKRTQIANDPLNLIATDAKLNRQKGDGDAATWLPLNKPYRCEYVARQIAVKAKYSLWVTPPEQVAMLAILNNCPGQKIP